MISVITAFLAIGGIIFIGFISNFLFNRYKIPDVLILIFLGVLIGPGLLGIVDSDMFVLIEDMAPFFAALALAMIMFDGGMGLNYDQVLKSITKTMFHSIVVFSLSIIITTGICYYFLGWGLIVSLLLGAILGGTSGAIVIPIVTRMNISGKTRTLLTIESALTDVMVIVMAMSILFFLHDGGGGVDVAVRNLVSAFFVSFMIGLIAGIAWLKVLAKLENQPFSYMVTIAALLVMYGGTDLLVGNTGVGAIAALIFGLVLGNKDEFARMFKKFKGEFKFNEEIRGFHSEITFFVRTFFFVYLGIVFSMTPVNIEYVVLGLGIFLGLLGIRAATSRGTCALLGMGEQDRMAVFFMMPRGLSAAVLASYPLVREVVTAEIGTAILSVTLVVIVLSTLMACVGAFTVERSAPSPEEKRKMSLRRKSRFAAKWMDSQESDSEMEFFDEEG